MTHLIFQESRILVLESGGLYLAPDAPERAHDPHGGELVVGEGEYRVRVLLLPGDVAPPAGAVPRGLRAALPLLDPEALRHAGRARQLLEWRENHRFCGRCGGETVLAAGGTALRCPGCGLSAFPRVSPAVIVLVHDGERMLLGRAHRFPHHRRGES